MHHILAFYGTPIESSNARNLDCILNDLYGEALILDRFYDYGQRFTTGEAAIVHDSISIVAL